MNEKKDIYKKIFEAKKSIDSISKDSKNPFFKSNYFDINKLLSEVEPVLQSNGLLLLQPIKENKVVSIIVDIETGDKVLSEIELPNVSDPQKLGSAITYYRRYTLQSLLGLQADDDDGNLASNNIERKQALTTEGYNYLLKNKVKKDIIKALNERRMSANQRNELTKLLKDAV